MWVNHILTWNTMDDRGMLSLFTWGLSCVSATTGSIKSQTSHCVTAVMLFLKFFSIKPYAFFHTNLLTLFREEKCFSYSVCSHSSLSAIISCVYRDPMFHVLLMRALVKNWCIWSTSIFFNRPSMYLLSIHSLLISKMEHPSTLGCLKCPEQISRNI